MLRRDRWNNRDVLKSFVDEFVDGATNLERPILDSIHAIDIRKHKGIKKASTSPTGPIGMRDFVPTCKANT